MLGTVKLTAKDLLWWPKDGEQWSVNGATGEKLLQFHWGNSHTHEDNCRGLQTVFRYICAKGAEFSPASAKALCAHQVPRLTESIMGSQDVVITLYNHLNTESTKTPENQGALWDAKLSKGVRQS
jgi:hypothetical protein